MLRFDGSTWSQEIVPETSNNLFSVWSTDAEHGFAVGFNGSFLERHQGTWSPVAGEIPTFQDLHSVWVDDQGELWSAGGRIFDVSGGALVHYGLPVSKEGL